MTDLQIPLFPIENSASAVTFTVWLGVCIVVFFNLRFGWTLSGLVVPGYLVPLLLVKPTVVGIIVCEAVMAYLIVRVLSDGWGRIPWWSSFFGRDRFFAIVLVSILVRAGADGWLLPSVGRWLNQTYNLQLDYRNDLHSYGLIVVSLIANYFWKPRLANGLFTSVVTVGITYWLVRYPILNLTNFSLGSLHYMYEDVSTSLLSSPKSYVIVITTAYLASWLNLRYSWDFNGILIPALLALLWHEPAKIAVTCLESLWILLVAGWVLKWSIWERVTVEGGRKLLLFFTIAAGHRIAVAHLLPLLGDYRVTDAFGFGYLLTSLIAIKSHDQKIPLRVLRATLQTSMLGAVVGSALGFGLAFVPNPLLWQRSTPETSSPSTDVEYTDRPLWQVLNEQRVQLYGMKFPGRYQPELPWELNRFGRGIKACLRFQASGESSVLEDAAELLAEANYRVCLVQNRYLVLREHQPARGWGTYVIRLDRREGLLVEVPAPLDEWATWESGLAIFDRLAARALAIAGTGGQAGADRGAGLLAERQTMLAAFHRLMAADDALQVRGWTPKRLQSDTGLSRSQASLAVTSVDSVLLIKNALPASLKLSALKQLLQSFEVKWEIAPSVNVLRDQTARGFGELVLSQHDRRRLRSRVGQITAGADAQVQQIDGSLNHWLQDDRQYVARQGSNAYVPCLVEEMLYLDEEIVRPLVLLARHCALFGRMDATQTEQAQAIAAAAATLEYQLVQFHDAASENDYFVLTESRPKSRHWGTFVFRAGLREPFVVEVPRPLYEQQAYQFGLSLFERPAAAALLVAGAHPYANVDGSADLTRLANKVNAMQLVRQVLLREFSWQNLLIIQARASQSPVDADVVLATDKGASQVQELSPLTRRVMQQLEADQLRVRLVDGSEATAGYEVGIMLQASSLNQTENKELISLWLSPSIRRRYRDSSTIRLAAAQFEALDIPTVTDDLFQFLVQRGGKLAAQARRPSQAALKRIPREFGHRPARSSSGSLFPQSADACHRCRDQPGISGDSIRGGSDSSGCEFGWLVVRRRRHGPRTGRQFRPGFRPDTEMDAGDGGRPMRNSLRAVMLVGLLVAVWVGLPSVRQHVREWVESQRQRRNVQDAVRSTAYPLSAQRWIEFDIPPNTTDLRVLTNAAVLNRDLPPRTLERPRQGWRYAIDYRLLTDESSASEAKTYHLRTRLHEITDPRSGAPLGVTWFQNSDRLPAQTQTVPLPLQGRQPRPTRLQLRLSSHDIQIEEVVVRVYSKYERSDFDQAYTWSRLAPERRARIARASVYPPELLSPREQRNLLRWNWSAVPPLGRAGTDYQRRQIYQYEEFQTDSSLFLPPENALTCEPGWPLVVPTPRGRGEVQLEFVPDPRLTRQVPVEVRVRRFRTTRGQVAEQVYSFGGRSEWPDRLVIPTDGELLEIRTNELLFVSAGYRPEAAAPSNLDELEPLVSAVTSFRADLVDAVCGLQYTVTHEDASAAPFRVTLRRLVPCAASLRAEDVPGIVPVAEVKYEWLGRDGTPVREGRLTTQSSTTLYDRAVIGSVPMVTTEPMTVYFSLPPNVGKIRFTCPTEDVALVAFTRPPGLKRKFRIPEESDDSEKREELGRSWFSLRSDDSDARIAENRSARLSIQPRPPDTNVDLLEGRYYWEDFSPNRFHSGRFALTRRDSDLAVRADAVAALFSQLPTNQELSIRWRPEPDRQTVEPRLIYAASRTITQPVRVWLDGQPFHVFTPRSLRGEVTLPQAVADGHVRTLRIESPDGLQVFLSQIQLEDAWLNVKRFLYQVGAEPLEFEITKRTPQAEFLILRIFSQIDAHPFGSDAVASDGSSAARVCVEVDVDGIPPRAPGPLAGWTLRRRTFQVVPSDRTPAVLLDGTDLVVDQGERCIVSLAEDLPPGSYRITVRRSDDLPLQAFASLYRLADEEVTRRTVETDLRDFSDRGTW